MSTTNAPLARLSSPARFGTIVGVAGWAVGASIVCLAAGELALLARVALPSLLLSLALGVACVAAIERSIRRDGQRAPATLWTKLGVLFSALAILLAVARVWTMPELLGSERVRAVLEATGSVTRVPAAAVLAPAAAGIVFLVLAARGGRRAVR